MTNIAADYIHRGLGGLNRRPVLTVIILLLAAFGMAVFAVWLGATRGPNPRKSELLYIVGIAAADHNRESICINYS
jgi:hypothetical protein